MRKGPGCEYEKRNISLVICDTDTPKQNSQNRLRSPIPEKLNFNNTYIIMWV